MPTASTWRYPSFNFPQDLAPVALRNAPMGGEKPGEREPALSDRADANIIHNQEVEAAWRDVNVPTNLEGLGLPASIDGWRKFLELDPYTDPSVVAGARDRWTTVVGDWLDRQRQYVNDMIDRAAENQIYAISVQTAEDDPKYGPR